MTNYAIVPTTEDHMLELAETMRQADIEEVWAGWRQTPLQALEASIRYTVRPWTALADGRVICIFGTAQAFVLSHKGFPWMLGAKGSLRHFKVLLRSSIEYVSEVKREFDFLENYVDARNTAAVKWLKWLGFVIENPAPFGPDQLDFCRFSMEGGA